MAKNIRGGRNTPRDGTTHSPAPLLSTRDLVILVISLVVSAMAGAVAGLTTTAQVGSASGNVDDVAVGITAGIVAFAVTGLVIATSLHKLLR
ncbi:hypothetical protein OG792_34265 [Micromonospora sp. NBC_01699]|uniref:hypothetical protein n=1 Tax=Micromonospora sp. NBC_01699 TaxID=2975984 RepID=UPI002E2AAF80|nr:hypothetical protein [Micromonospora sp. NBC_01699]